MAATLGVYTGAVLFMALWLRQRLFTPRETFVPFNPDALIGLMVGYDDKMTVILSPRLPGAWILTNTTVTPTGQEFTGPVDPVQCGSQAPMQTCMDWLGTLNLRQALTYQPASRFWAMQWAETGIFLALAAALAGFCFWWLRRRAAR
jgi:hypothetical protein